MMYVVLSMESRVTTKGCVKECITMKFIEGEKRKIWKKNRSIQRKKKVKKIDKSGIRRGGIFQKCIF